MQKHIHKMWYPMPSSITSVYLIHVSTHTHTHTNKYNFTKIIPTPTVSAFCLSATTTYPMLYMLI